MWRRQLPAFCCLPGILVTRAGPGSCCPGQGGKGCHAGQLSRTGDGVFQARGWVSSQGSHLSELPPKARGDPPAEARAWLVYRRCDLENLLSQVSRCRRMKVQGQDFVKVHPFMVRKGLMPWPGGSPPPRGEAPEAMGCPGSGQAARAESSLPWKAFAPKQSIAFFKTCYKPSAQPQCWIPMAPSVLRGAVLQQLEGLQHLVPN